MKVPTRLLQWLEAAYPEFPHVYWGVSGAALLFDALKQEGRRKIIVPGFICPEIPAMALATGMEVVVVDVNPLTLHMPVESIEKCVADSSDTDTVLLVDHTFGYPFTGLPGIRHSHPNLLLIEDCARALGSRINGQPVGYTGDWVLLSMYKTTPGNNHGAILLTRSPYKMSSGPSPKTTWRQRISTNQTLRMLYEWARKSRPDFGETKRDVKSLNWVPTFGMPNQLCLTRFEQSVMRLEDDLRFRRRVADKIQSELGKIAGIRCVQAGAGCDPASYFLSFTVALGTDRNRLLTALHRRGLFLLRTWDSVPAYFQSFRPALRFGAEGSVFLAGHVAHVPIVRFGAPSRQDLLTRSLSELAGI
jgi:dTDP-4-amino-4,6-dideoxygalactose transaminase